MPKEKRGKGKKEKIKIATELRPAFSHFLSELVLAAVMSGLKFQSRNEVNLRDISLVMKRKEGERKEGGIGMDSTDHDRQVRLSGCFCHPLEDDASRAPNCWTATPRSSQKRSGRKRGKRKRVG